MAYRHKAICARAPVAREFAVMATPVGPSAQAAKRPEWNTRAFFEAVTPGDATRRLEAGADLEARAVGDQTPLHAAAAKTDNPAVVEALLDAGANPAERNERGRTPFYYAKRNEALKGTDVYWRLNEARFQ